MGGGSAGVKLVRNFQEFPVLVEVREGGEKTHQKQKKIPNLKWKQRKRGKGVAILGHMSSND